MTVQEEIAWQISEALRLKLTGDAEEEAAQATDRQSGGLPGIPARTLSLEQLDAGRLPPRARALRARRSRSTRPTRWPTPASATRYGAMAYYGFIVAARTGFPRAAGRRRARARARSRRSPTRTSRSALGHLFAEWDWPAAERELRRRSRSIPKHAVAARGLRALSLRHAGRFDEALPEAATARELDPLSIFNNIGVAWAHHFAGRHRDAIHEALRVRDLVPGLEEAGNILMGSYELLGRFEDAAQLASEQRCWGMPARRRGAARGVSCRRRDGLLARRGSS